MHIRRPIRASSPALLARVRYARTLLANATPLKADCGDYCARACCTSRGSMQLLAGEDALCRAFSVAESPDGTFMTCSGACDRGERPFACRLFPLTYRRPKEGERDYRLALEPRGRGLCPLCTGSLRSLDPGFLAAAKEAGRILAGHPLTRRWLDVHADLYDEYREMARAFGV